MEECEDSSSEEIVVGPPRRMKYTRGGSGGSGSCPGSLDDCVALCPSEVRLVTKREGASMNAVEPEPMGVRHVAKAAENRDTWELGMTMTIYVTERALGTCPMLAPLENDHSIMIII